MTQKLYICQVCFYRPMKQTLFSKQDFFFFFWLSYVHLNYFNFGWMFISLFFNKMLETPSTYITQHDRINQENILIFSVVCNLQSYLRPSFKITLFRFRAFMNTKANFISSDKKVQLRLFSCHYHIRGQCKAQLNIQNIS